MYLSSPLGPVKARVTPALLTAHVRVCQHSESTRVIQHVFIAKPLPGRQDRHDVLVAALCYIIRSAP